MKQERRIPEFRGNVYLSALKGLYVGGSSVSLIKKECFQKAGLFDEALITAEDWEMSVRIAKYFEFDFIPDILTKTHMHGEQLSHMLEGKIKSRQHILQKHYNELLKYPVLLADHLNRLGVLCCIAGNCIAGNFAEGKKFFLDSIKIRPVQRFAYSHFLPLLFAPELYRRRLDRSIDKMDGMALHW